jgi:hypothetical protein
MAYYSLIAAQIKLLNMKKIVTLTCAALFFIATAFTQASAIDDVISALRNGNATELSKYIDNNIELSMPSKTDNYSRQQAVVILQDFFSTNGAKGFEVKHKGENGGSKFCIGTLSTRSGLFRTTFFLTEKNGRQLIKEIRFQSM